jgi:flagellar biosynthesis/type III secretory pathway protein FliH
MDKEITIAVFELNRQKREKYGEGYAAGYNEGFDAGMAAAWQQIEKLAGEQIARM